MLLPIDALVIAGADFFWQQVAIGLIVVVVVTVTVNNVRELRIGWLSRPPAVPGTERAPRGQGQ